MKTLAIIIPAYKSQNFINHCVKSVQLQSIPKDWTIDIRVGIDGCKETLKSIKSDCCYFAENVGAYIMRNSLILSGTAHAYCLFDADDIMKPGYIAETINAIESGHDIIMLSKTNVDENLVPINEKIEDGGAITFTDKSWQAVGGYQPYKVAGDSDIMRRFEIAGFTIHKIETPLYYRRRHLESLTKKSDTGIGSDYRKEVWQKMTELRASGIIKVEPETVELQKIEYKQKFNTPVFILTRTSGRPIFFNRCMQSINNQTYDNIITIVHTDNPFDKYIAGDIIISSEKIANGTNAPYNLYCNKLLESIPDENGYYFFLDDDDQFFENNSLEKFISQCKESDINVARVMRWNFEIFPKHWGKETSFQTECFILHTKHKSLGKWWSNKGGDHYYSKQITEKLNINWIDKLIVCKVQESKGHGRCYDYGGLPQSLQIVPDNKQVPVLYLERVITPQTARGRQGEVKMIIYRRAKMLENKGHVRILSDELYKQFIQSGRDMEVIYEPQF